MASLRPLMWLDPVIADLGLTSMACRRFALETGPLLTKTQVIEQAHGQRDAVASDESAADVE